MTRKALNILIADDHPLFREALTYIVEASFSSSESNTEKNNSEENEIKENSTAIEILNTVDHEATLTAIEQHSIDWLFLDLNMPGSNGLSGLANIKKQHPTLPIIVISANESPDIIQSCLSYDIAGYITKSTQPNDIETAIQTILTGKQYSPLTTNPSNYPPNQPKPSGIEKLTAAQLNILIHIGIGKLNKQIAQDLAITEATVKAHITQIYKKLNVNNRTQAALIAKQAELVD